MEKKTLYSREDFQDWYHDIPISYVFKHTTYENEPKKYPCVVSWREIDSGDMFYGFIYIDDFV